MQMGIYVTVVLTKDTLVYVRAFDVGVRIAFVAEALERTARIFAGSRTLHIIQFHPKKQRGQNQLQRISTVLSIRRKAYDVDLLDDRHE